MQFSPHDKTDAKCSIINGRKVGEHSLFLYSQPPQLLSSNTTYDQNDVAIFNFIAVLRFPVIFYFPPFLPVVVVKIKNEKKSNDFSRKVEKGHTDYNASPTESTTVRRF